MNIGSGLYPDIDTLWICLWRGYGRSEDDYGSGVEDAEGDVEEAAVDT